MIRDAMFGNRRHNGDLVRLSEEEIASNILANRLVRLVQSGLLSHADDPVHKQKASLRKYKPEVTKTAKEHYSE